MFLGSERHCISGAVPSIVMISYISQQPSKGFLVAGSTWITKAEIDGIEQDPPVHRQTGRPADHSKQAATARAIPHLHTRGECAILILIVYGRSPINDQFTGADHLAHCDFPIADARVLVPDNHLILEPFTRKRHIQKRLRLPTMASGARLHPLQGALWVLMGAAARSLCTMSVSGNSLPSRKQTPTALPSANSSMSRYTQGHSADYCLPIVTEP